ncbi:hypothetical protein [Brasilonema bromeliae]|uniref:PepSY domain-containing protein n=1 Tax=Brasilonema bromeliae SPC951 TaxID=385972 RepID=A0ABX1P7Q0_9CYAN|nr:hypothetical protein [Brasilonema bromeliae]NMG19852.1 hypothetical protein [Brasilonema bromeliae SPC951]
MKDINKLYPALNKILKSPKGILLTLTLTSLFSSGLGVVGNYPAAASGEDEQIQSSYSSVQISQTTNQNSSYSRIQISQTTNQNSNGLPRRIENAILRDASKRSGVPIRELQITEATAKTFSNPCIFKFGEVCTREFNPIKGWEVVVRVQDNSWTYHVNESGSEIVLDPKVSTSQSTTLPKEIEDAILGDASKRSRIPTSNLKVTKATAKTFGNPCEFKFGEICTKEYNPIKGWEVVVQVGRQSWTYHVNESGSQLVLDPKISGGLKN